MTTPKKKKPVDLSKCKVGQEVRLRNGNTVIIEATSGGLPGFPILASNGDSYTKTGRYFGDNSPSAIDIVEVLPLPKRKKAPSPKLVESDVETFTSLFAQIAFSNDAAWVKRAVKALQFIKKP